MISPKCHALQFVLVYSWPDAQEEVHKLFKVRILVKSSKMCVRRMQVLNSLHFSWTVVLSNNETTKPSCKRPANMYQEGTAEQIFFWCLNSFCLSLCHSTVTNTMRTCAFFAARSLPCCHLFAAQHLLEKTAFDLTFGPKRWSIEYFKSYHKLQSGKFSLPENESAICSDLVTVSTKVISQNEKYKKVFQTCHALAN